MCMEEGLLKLLLRWVFISMLALGNAIVLAILVVVVYTRVSVGAMMGRGISVSELAGAYISLIATSGGVGLLVLAAISLYWAIGLRWIPVLRNHAGEHSMMKLSLVVIPLWFFLIFLLSKVLFK